MPDTERSWAVALRECLQRLKRILKSDQDALTLALYGWQFGRGLGWLAPWSNPGERQAYGALSEWGGHIFTSPLALLALWGVISGGLAWWAWFGRRWSIISWLDVTWVPICMVLAAGFIATRTDPPATAYVILSFLHVVNMVRSGRRAQLMRHITRQVEDANGGDHRSDHHGDAVED